MNRPTRLSTLLLALAMIPPMSLRDVAADTDTSRIIVRYTDTYAHEARQIDESLGNAGYRVTMEPVQRRRTDLLGNSLRFKVLHIEAHSHTAAVIRDIVADTLSDPAWDTIPARPLVGTDGRIVDPRKLLGSEDEYRTYLVYLYPHNNDSLFFEAAASGNAAEIQRLLDAGMDVDFRDYTGSTALMIAAREGNADVVDVLLSAGADVNLRNDYDTTALLNAVYMNHLDVVRLLVGSGADARARNIDGSALEIAFDLSHLAIATYLKEQLDRLEI